MQLQKKMEELNNSSYIIMSIYVHYTFIQGIMDLKFQDFFFFLESLKTFNLI